MRINRDTLLRIAQDTVKQRVRKDRSLLSAYLCGSLLGDGYLLGGTADIDLVFVHFDAPPEGREIVGLTQEVHLDIAHYAQKEFRNTRKLRAHPWMGPTIFACQVLHDPQHFMDFTQASVRGQFNRPEYILERARTQAEHARQIWMAFYREMPTQPGPQELELYLRAVGHAANAIASLSGPPIAERRLLLEFPRRAEAVDRPGLQPGLLGLLGAPRVDHAAVRAWLADWQASLDKLPQGYSLARLHPARSAYYRLAFEALLDGVEPMAVLWPLLRTWTDAVRLQPVDEDARQAWNQALQALNLAGAGFAERVEALDAYLDLVEDTLEGWAEQAGI
ncbi:MAG: hypothetical protein JSV61_00020 [Anaerolineales bacterium]|nr:MAG: hypothetical protein JSV61_00020 [Anaerolineales bacterium]